MDLRILGLSFIPFLIRFDRFYADQIQTGQKDKLAYEAHSVLAYESAITPGIMIQSRLP